MVIFTDTIKYRGKDRLDITVKSAKGFAKLVSPTWLMVMNLKNKIITEEQYEKEYFLSIENTLPTFVRKLKELIKTPKATRTITFVCYCKANAFCHRKLLAKYLAENYGFQYLGERTDYKHNQIKLF
jgi:uncharacterized protein YeaO (DUF488 family)